MSYVQNSTEEEALSLPMHPLQASLGSWLGVVLRQELQIENGFWMFEAFSLDQSSRVALWGNLALVAV